MSLTNNQKEKLKLNMEANAAYQGYPIPEGFCITHNEPLNKTTLFLDQPAFDKGHIEGDIIFTQWVNGKWEDK